MNEAYEKVFGFLKLEFNIDALEHNTPLIDGGYIDSMQILELVSFIEKEFGLEIDPADMRVENFASIDDILAFISEKTET